jgi:hypothetical protein
MLRLFGALLVIGMVLGACGGDGSGGGATATDGGGGGGGGGDLPRGQSVLFGTSFDPVTLAVTGKDTKFTQGTPVVAVARTLTPRPMSEVAVTVQSPGQNAPKRAVTAAVNPDNGDLFAVDLSADNLGPAVWTVNFVSTNGRIIASGFLTITP